MLVNAEDRRIALFNVGGTCHAIDDTCTHRGGPLSEGTIDGVVVTCPWHGARFCVRDGQAQGPPALATSRRTCTRDSRYERETPGTRLAGVFKLPAAAAHAGTRHRAYRRS